MFKVTILDTFMDRQINIEIDNKRMYYKDWNMTYFKEVTIMNLSDFQMLNYSVVDDVTSQWQRFSNNLFQFIRARIQNFIENNKYNKVTFYLIRNFIDLKSDNKDNNFTFEVKEFSDDSTTIFNEHLLLIEEI